MLYKKVSTQSTNELLSLWKQIKDLFIKFIDHKSIQVLVMLLPFVVSQHKYLLFHSVNILTFHNTLCMCVSIQIYFNVEHLHQILLK